MTNGKYSPLLHSSSPFLPYGPVTNAGRWVCSMHDASRPLTEPALTNCATKVSVHSFRVVCPPYRLITCLLFGRYFAAVSAIYGGVTGSPSPDRIRTGVFDLIGSE